MLVHSKIMLEFAGILGRLFIRKALLAANHDWEYTEQTSLGSQSS